VLSVAPLRAPAGPSTPPTIEADALPAVGDKVNGSGTAETIPGSGLVRPSPSPPVAQGGTPGGGLCDTSGVDQFTDVGVGDYGAAYILCMRALGLSVGKGGGEFGPDQTLTRAQMASFLVRLWRDVLGRSCPGGRAPFTDVAGSVHEDNIVCLYNLGITVGTTTTTYSPGDDLTASQISRFLLRTYERTGHRCPNGASELDRAVACLVALNVIPDGEQGRSTLVVARSQMAVYVIGLWHNLAGGRLPPSPPRPRFDLALPIPDELVPEANVVTTGRMELPVYICAPAGRYTIAHLRSATNKLNQRVATFFREQSSGEVDIQFVTGGVVSPPLDWDGITMHTLWKYYGDDPCSNAAIEQEQHTQLAILVDVRTSPNVAGYALVGLGPAVQSMEHHLSSEGAYLDLVGHEVGHSRFGFFHPQDWENSDHPLGRYHNENVYDPGDDSIMSYSGTRNIDTTHISCAHRVQAGWPPGPPLPGGRACPGGTGPGQGDSVPNPPRNLSVTQSDGQLIVRWKPPSSPQGWEWLTGYTVSFDDGRGHTDERTVSDTRVIIGGLTNGVAYTIEVTANNEVGPSEPAVGVGTPMANTTVPGPPTNVSVTPGDGGLWVEWRHPVNDGGSPVTGFVVTIDDGTSTFDERYSRHTVGSSFRGLTNGHPYTVTVQAENGHGVGPPSTPIVGIPTGPRQDVPAPPRDVEVTAGDRELTVTWSFSTYDGGSPITGYTIAPADGATTTSHTVGPRTRSYRSTGLTNGIEYTIRVTANNAVGSSRPAAVRGTPMAATTTPGPPTNVRVDEGDRQLTVNWLAPIDDGGSPVTAYVVRHSNGRDEATITVGSNSRSYRIVGLSNDVRYTIWVHARNRSGDGPASAPVTAFPTGVAIAPATPFVTAVATGDRIDASWWAADNGAPIDRWEIGGVGEVIAGVTSYTWQNVSPGNYQVRVRARNAGGWSPWGNTSVTVTTSPTVTISKGNLGPTSGPDVGDAPCATNDPSCRWINLTVDGFPQGTYTGRCVHQGFRWPNGTISAGGWWREFTIDVGSTGAATLTKPCYITFSALRGNGAHIAVNLNGRWINSNTLAPDTNFVLLNRGGPGPTTAPRPGSIPCAVNAPDCRWLRIELRNFSPGRYRVYCAHDGWNNGQYPAGSWHNFETTIGSNGGATITNSCYINIPRTDGRGVRIHVGQASQPTGQYQWSSNWLR